MPSRITRRRLVGLLARGTSAAAALVMLQGSGAGVIAASVDPMRPALSPSSATNGASGPVQVRMADVTLAGRELRAGHADGVRLPGQGGADTWSLSAERAGGVYTSPPLQAAFPCSHVGVRWQADADVRGLRVELRSSRDGQTWMSWRAVQQESHGPDRLGRDDATRVRETFGTLVGGRLGVRHQVRLTFSEAGPSQGSVTSLTLTCLDSRRPTAALTDPASAQRATTGRPDPGSSAASALAVAPAAEPMMLRAGRAGFLERVVSREAWGADESLRFKDGAEVWPTAFVQPSLLVVHHTATDGDLGDAEADVRAIYAYHAVTQGWGDIGYQLLIDSSGRVYEGRRGREPDAQGRREIVSENVVAGHALDYNYGSVGIALLGNYQLRQPSPIMLDALVDALAFMAQRAGVDPTTVAAYPRARGDGTVLWRDALNSLSGHRDCIPTECPGDNVYGLLPSIRERVQEALGAAGLAVRITRGPADRNLWPGDLVFAWQPDPGAVEVSVRLAGWIRAPGSDRIVAFSGYDDDERPVWGPWTRQSDVSAPLPPDARGVYTLFVRARDASGRIGRVVARWHLAVDRHVVVDDADALRTRHDGDWTHSRSVLGFYGLGYQAATADQPDARFRWQLAAPEDGAYRLFASWTEGEDRSARATYRLSQGGHPLGEVTVNQQAAGGRWERLLDAPLQAGVPCIVELAGADDGAVIADAVRLVYLG